MLWSSKPRMTRMFGNDEIRMSKDEGMTTPECRICVICGTLSALSVLRVLCGEIARLFRRGRRCNGRQATARLSNMYASRALSPDPCNPCHPWFKPLGVSQRRPGTFVPIRVHSWLAFRKFSLNPVEGMAKSDLNASRLRRR
jgi:hypothetical protein